MSNVRRWYIYAVCAISLQAVAWAIIALLRNLFIFGVNPLAVAFQIAVVIIGLPVFLAHWMWGRRLVGKSEDEHGATVRRLYLYGNMAGFLGPFVANAFDLIRRLMGGTNALQINTYNRPLGGDVVIYHLTALVVCAGLWFFHRQVAAEDARVVAETGGSATVRRLYLLGFSAAGLTMTMLGLIHLARWIMTGVAGGVIRKSGVEIQLVTEICRLLIGLPLWIIFWRGAQRLFDSPSEEERGSALRKFYLYGAVFIGALCAVANATGILAGLFRRLLDLAPKGNIRQPLSIVIGMAVLWAFHAIVLRDDARQAGEAPRQAGVRRLYLYLIAAVGFSALLVGLGGVISVLLRTIGAGFGNGLREELAWYSAAIIAGLPVWIIPWRQAQGVAAAKGPASSEERRSVVRKVYLYFFLFIATMTMLSSAVYIVYGILSMILGGKPPTLPQLGHAIAFSLIAAAVWLYHGSALRSDGKLARLEQSGLLEALRVVVLDVADGLFGNAVVARLKREFPDIALEPLTLAPQAAGTAPDQKAITTRLAEAGLIVAPWQAVIRGGAVSDETAAAVAASPARKLLVPSRSEGWDWVGLERWDAETIVQQTARAVKQILAGEEVKAHRPMSAGSIIGIISTATPHDHEH